MSESMIIYLTTGCIMALLMTFGHKIFVLLREYGARFGLIKSLDLTNKARSYAQEHAMAVIMDHDDKTNTFSVKAVRHLPISYTRAIDPFGPMVEKMFEISNLQMGEAWLKAEELAELYGCQVHVTSKSRRYHSIHEFSGARPTAC